MMAMSDERLVFLKGAAVPDYTRGEFLDEALYEIEDLRAEVERLSTPKAAIEIIAALENWNNSAAEWKALCETAETLNFQRVNSAQDIIGDLWDILNPEPGA